MDDDELQVMRAAMKKLMDAESSPLLKPSNLAKAEGARARLEKYQGWKTELSGKMEDLLEYSRIKEECVALDKSVKELEAERERRQDALNEAKEKCGEIDKEVADVRELVDMSKRWYEDAGRISEKRLQISSKHDTSMSMSMSVPDTAGRDMKTVERDLNDKREEKETMMNKIARLNKEMSTSELEPRVCLLSFDLKHSSHSPSMCAILLFSGILNNEISQLSYKVSLAGSCDRKILFCLEINRSDVVGMCLQADRTEKILKEKEARYAKEQEVTVKRAALTEKIEIIDAEDKKVS